VAQHKSIVVHDCQFAMSVKIVTEGKCLVVSVSILNRSQLMLATNDNPPPHVCPSGLDGIELD